MTILCETIHVGFLLQIFETYLSVLLLFRSARACYYLYLLDHGWLLLQGSNQRQRLVQESFPEPGNNRLVISILAWASSYQLILPGDSILYERV